VTNRAPPPSRGPDRILPLGHVIKPFCHVAGDDFTQVLRLVFFGQLCIALYPYKALMSVIDQRQDGKNYIDDTVEGAMVVLDNTEGDSSSGSSVVEEDGEEEPVWSESDSEEEEADGDLEKAYEEEADDQEDWDVEGEDWELADGGE
jgi:hypothetical protein